MALEVGDIIPIYVGDRKTLGQIKTLGNAGGELVVVEVPEDSREHSTDPTDSAPDTARLAASKPNASRRGTS
jgi:hypothetical protein